MFDNNTIHLTVGPITTNCWICPIGDGLAAVIDPGDEADQIISVLKKSSLNLKYILLTHGHFDHIAAVPALVSAFDPKPQIAIHRLDSHYLGSDAYNIHSLSIKSAMGSTAFIDALWNNLPPPDILLDEGSEIGPFTVLHLPGHTHGSAAFWDKETKRLFTGDTLFRRGYGRTDLLDGNEDKIYNSLQRLFNMDPDIKVFPGHGQTTTIGQERR